MVGAKSRNLHLPHRWRCARVANSVISSRVNAGGDRTSCSRARAALLLFLHPHITANTTDYW